MRLRGRKRFTIGMTAVVVLVAAIICYRHYWQNGGPAGEPYIAFVTFDTSIGNLIRGAAGSMVPELDNGVPMKLYYCDREGNTRFVRKLNRSIDMNRDFSCTLDEAFIVDGCLPYYEHEDGQGGDYWLDLASNTYSNDIPPWENGIFPVYDGCRINSELIGIKSHMTSNRISRNVFLWNRSKRQWESVQNDIFRRLLRNANHPCAVVGDYAIFAAIDRADASKAEILVVEISTGSLKKCYGIATWCDSGQHGITITELGEVDSQLLSSQRKPAITNLQIAASPTWSYFNSVDILAESYQSETIIKLSYDYDDSTVDWENLTGDYYISLNSEDYSVSYSGEDCPVNVELNNKRATIKKIVRTGNPDINYLLVEINGNKFNSYSCFYRLSVDNEPVFIDRKADAFISSYLVAEDDSLWYVGNAREIGEKSLYAFITDTECDLMRYDPVTGDKRKILDHSIFLTLYKTIE